MLKKIRLKQTDDYEVAFVTKQIASMVVSYIQGISHDKSIGSEQGFEKWDDFIILTAEDGNKHIQVKQQNTDFSDDACVRDGITKGPRKGTLKDLSELDKTFASLAEWTKNNDPNNSPKHSFLFAAPNNTVSIKRGISLRHLEQLCNHDINPSTTTQGLESLSNASAETQSIFQWLTSWCGFTDWNHIFKAFRDFKIIITGNKESIDNQTDEILSKCFGDSGEVRKKIHSYLDENTSFTSAITPRPLLAVLHSYLLPGIPTWTQYRRYENDWQISGTHDMSHTTVENAKPVVAILWDAKIKSELKFHAPIETKGTPLSKAIIRLALHLKGLSAAYITKEGEWREVSKNYIGGTIGINEDDYGDINAFDCPVSFTSSDVRDLNNLEKQDEEANKLNLEMYRDTWNKIRNTLNHKISDLKSSELRNAIEKRWLIWEKLLTINESECSSFCKSMLHPTAEGENILSDLRVGPKTVPLITNGIFLLLVVSIALSDNDNEWKCFQDVLTVRTNALRYWSGPADGRQRVRKLTDDGIDNLLGKERAKILILSEVEASPIDIQSISLADSNEPQDNLATPHRPTLLVTSSPELNRLIRIGNLRAICEYFADKLLPAIFNRA